MFIFSLSEGIRLLPGQVPTRAPTPFFFSLKFGSRARLQDPPVATPVVEECICWCTQARAPSLQDLTGSLLRHSRTDEWESLGHSHEGRGLPWPEDLQLGSLDVLRELHHHWGAVLWL